MVGEEAGILGRSGGSGTGALAWAARSSRQAPASAAITASSALRVRIDPLVKAVASAAGDGSCGDGNLRTRIMPIRAILFDKDGTLIDFQRTWGPATHTVLTRLSNGDPAAFQRLAAVSLYDPAERLLLSASPLVIETL